MNFYNSLEKILIPEFLRQCISDRNEDPGNEIRRVMRPFVISGMPAGTLISRGKAMIFAMHADVPAAESLDKRAENAKVKRREMLK